MLARIQWTSPVEYCCCTVDLVDLVYRFIVTTRRNYRRGPLVSGVLPSPGHHCTLWIKSVCVWPPKILLSCPRLAVTLPRLTIEKHFDRIDYFELLHV